MTRRWTQPEQAIWLADAIARGEDALPYSSCSLLDVLLYGQRVPVSGPTCGKFAVEDMDAS